MTSNLPLCLNKHPCETTEKVWTDTKVQNCANFTFTQVGSFLTQYYKKHTPGVYDTGMLIISKLEAINEYILHRELSNLLNQRHSNSVSPPVDWHEHMYSWHDSNGLLCQPHTHTRTRNSVCVSGSVNTSAHHRICAAGLKCRRVCGNSSRVIPPPQALMGMRDTCWETRAPKWQPFFHTKCGKQETESEPCLHYQLNLVNSRMKQSMLNQQVAPTGYITLWELA